MKSEKKREHDEERAIDEKNEDVENQIEELNRKKTLFAIGGKHCERRLSGGGENDEVKNNKEKVIE